MTRITKPSASELADFRNWLRQTKQETPPTEHTDISVPIRAARYLLSDPSKDSSHPDHGKVGVFQRVADEHVSTDPDTWRMVIRDNRTGMHYAARHVQSHMDWLQYGQHNYPWPNQTAVTFTPVKPVTKLIEVTEYQDVNPA